MHPILKYIKVSGLFMAECVKGHYDNVPFTHEEWIAFTHDLHEKLKDRELDFSDDLIVCKVMPFEVEGEDFVLRFLAMFEEAHVLVTRQLHQENWPEETPQDDEAYKGLPN